MTNDRDAQHSDDARIGSHDDAEVARWAQALCTSQDELRAAVNAVGSEAGKVKRYLFTVLLRRHTRARP